MTLITGCRSVNMCCQECYVGIITQRSNINKDVHLTARLSSALHVNCCCSQSQWGETGIIRLPDSIHLGGRDTKTGQRRGKITKTRHLLSETHTRVFHITIFSFHSREPCALAQSLQISTCKRIINSLWWPCSVLLKQLCLVASELSSSI